jgi:hypothetical protein
MALEYGIGRKGQKWVSPDRLSYQTTPISIKQILCSNFCVQTLDVDSFFTEWQYLHCSVSFPFTLSKTDWAMWKASQYSSALTGWKLIFWVLTLDQYLVTNSLIFSHHYCLRYSLCQAFALHAYPLSVTIRLFHVIIHMIPALVTYHLMNDWPSRTLFRVINFIVLRKFDLKHYQGFGYTLNTHSHRSCLWPEIRIKQILIIPIHDFICSSMFHRSYIKDQDCDRIPQY